MADTRFHNRQWENPLKRVTQQNKERLQHQKDEVNAYVEQQSGKIQLMRAAGDAAGRNMDFAVNDFIGAYKKIVDDRADSWKAWSKLLTQDAPKAYRQYVVSEELIGARKKVAQGDIQKAFNYDQTVLEGYGKLDTTESSNAFDEDRNFGGLEGVNSGNVGDPDLAKTIYQSPLPDQTDVVSFSQEAILAKAGELLGEDKTLTPYQRAVQMAGLSNKHQERGFLQQYVLEAAGNPALIEDWMKNNNDEVELSDGTIIVPSEMSLDTPMEHWREVRQLAEDAIIGDLLISDVNGVSLNAQFVVDKVDPILQRNRNNAINEREDAYVQHQFGKEIAQIESDLTVAFSSTSNPQALAGHIQTSVTRLFNAYKNADAGKGTYGTNFKKNLPVIFKKAFELTKKNGGNVGNLKQALLQLKGNFPWTDGVVPYSEAFPNIYGVKVSHSDGSTSFTGLDKIQIDVEKQILTDQRAKIEVSLEDLLVSLQAAKEANETEKYNALSLDFDELVQTSQNSAAYQLRKQKIDEWKPPLEGADAFDHLERRFQEKGYWTQNDLKDVSEDARTQFFNDPRNDRSLIFSSHPGQDSRFADQIQAVKKASETYFTDEINKKTAMKTGAPGYSSAHENFFKTGGIRDQIIIQLAKGDIKTVDGQTLNASTNAVVLQQAANEILKERFREDDYAETGIATEYTLDPELGWIWHKRDRNDYNKTQTQEAVEEVRGRLGEDSDAWKIVPELRNIDGWNKLDSKGNYHSAIREIAKAAGVAPLDVLLSNGIFFNESVEIVDGVQSQGEELSKMFKERWGYTPQPGSKELLRKLAELDKFTWVPNNWATWGVPGSGDAFNAMFNKKSPFHSSNADKDLIAVDESGIRLHSWLPNTSGHISKEQRELAIRLRKDYLEGSGFHQFRWNPFHNREQVFKEWKKRRQAQLIQMSKEEMFEVSQNAAKTTRTPTQALTRSILEVRARNFGATNTYSFSFNSGTTNNQGWSKPEYSDQNRNQIVFKTVEAFGAYEKINDLFLWATGTDLNDRVTATKNSTDFEPILPNSQKEAYHQNSIVLEINGPLNKETVQTLRRLDPSGTVYGWQYRTDINGIGYLIYLPPRNSEGKKVTAGN